MDPAASASRSQRTGSSSTTATISSQASNQSSGYGLSSHNSSSNNLHGAHEFFSSLHDLHREGHMTDIKVAVDNGVEFRAHRVVLAASSAYFRAVFTSPVGNQRKEDCDVVQLTGGVVEPHSFKIVLEYMYSRKLKLTPADVFDVLRDACYLLMPDVEAKCSAYIARTISPEICFEYLQLAGALSSSQLTEVVLKFVCRQGFGILAKSSDLLKLDFMLFRDIMANELMGQLTEDHLLDIILVWTRHDNTIQDDEDAMNRSLVADDRKRLLLNLVKLLRLKQAKPNFLKAKLRSEDLIKDDQVCRDIFESVVSHSEEFQPTTVPRGGLIYANTGPYELSVYDPMVRQWSNSIRAPYNMDLSCVTIFPGGDSTLGFVGSDSRTNSTQADDLGLGSFMVGLDTRTRTWRALPSLTSVRCRPAVVAVPYADLIVVAGGIVEAQDIIFCKHLDTCEALHLSQQKWRPITSLAHHGGDGLRMVTVQDRIIALGGVECSTSSVSNKASYVPVTCLVNEEYEVVSDSGWFEMTPMTRKRTHFGAAILNDALYAVGGHTELGVESSVEFYDFEKSAWFELPSAELPQPSPIVTACSYGGLLACLFSFTSDLTASLSPYKLLTYDPRDGRWHDGDFVPSPSRMGNTFPSMAAVPN